MYFLMIRPQKAKAQAQSRLLNTVDVGDEILTVGGIYGIVERYPTIKADRGFQKLQDELSDTETRIALARSFFNESVTSLNNRIETMPDALIAGPARFKKADYFKIEEFERAPVSIRQELEKGATA